MLNVLLIEKSIISSGPVCSKSRFAGQPSAELVERIVATQPALYKSPSVPQASVGRPQKINPARSASPQSPVVPQPSVGRFRRLLGTMLPRETKPQNVKPGSLGRLLHRVSMSITILEPTNSAVDYLVYLKLTKLPSPRVHVGSSAA